MGSGSARQDGQHRGLGECTRADLPGDSRPAEERGLGLPWWSGSWDSALPTEEAWGLIPGQGMGFHMLQLRVHNATTKDPACCKEDPGQPKQERNWGCTRLAAGPLPPRAAAVQGSCPGREKHQETRSLPPCCRDQRHGSRLLLSLSLACTLTPPLHPTLNAAPRTHSPLYHLWDTMNARRKEAGPEDVYALKSVFYLRTFQTKHSNPSISELHLPPKSILGGHLTRPGETTDILEGTSDWNALHGLRLGRAAPRNISGWAWKGHSSRTRTLHKHSTIHILIKRTPNSTPTICKSSLFPGPQTPHPQRGLSQGASQLTEASTIVSGLTSDNRTPLRCHKCLLKHLQVLLVYQ